MPEAENVVEASESSSVSNSDICNQHNDFLSIESLSKSNEENKEMDYTIESNDCSVLPENLDLIKNVDDKSNPEDSSVLSSDRTEDSYLSGEPAKELIKLEIKNENEELSCVDTETTFVPKLITESIKPYEADQSSE